MCNKTESDIIEREKLVAYTLYKRKLRTITINTQFLSESELIDLIVAMVNGLKIEYIERFDDILQVKTRLPLAIINEILAKYEFELD